VLQIDVYLQIVLVSYFLPLSSLANSEKSFIISSVRGTFKLLGIAGECLGL